MNPLTIPKAGDLIADKYRVERVIGQGGMGVVLAAVHDALDTRVAIKLLGAKDDDAAVRRFMREARAASKMQSAHVVRVLDVGSRDDGTPFMVMEYLEGEDLSEMVSRGHLSVAQAIRYLLHACEGLAEAHAMGLVHRDLKPSNLFLARRRDGEELVKVLDFGIALAVDGGQNQRLTATGASLGSPLYMSPEQIRNSKVVDERTDVWGLGSVLFELLSGRTAFEAETITALCVAIANDPPASLAELRPELPTELVKVVERCLAKEADDRFADVGELAAALAPFGDADAEGSVSRTSKLLGEIRKAALEATVPSSRGANPAAREAEVLPSEAATKPSAKAASEPPSFSDTATGWQGEPAGVPPQRSKRVAMALAAAVVVVAVGAWLGIRGEGIRGEGIRGEGPTDPEPGTGITTTDELGATATPAPEQPSAGTPSPEPSAQPAEGPSAEPPAPRPDPTMEAKVAPEPKSPTSARATISPVPVKPPPPPPPRETTSDPLSDRK